MRLPDTSLDAATRQTGQAIQQAAANPWTERLARAGHLAKGLVYVIVGVLALQVALGVGGQTTDTEGALLAIVARPFGVAMLALVAVGLIGYALWRLLQAALDLEHKGSDAKGVANRLGYAANGLAYGALAVVAIRIITATRQEGGGGEPSDWTARLMAQPFGPWLVGAVGLAIVGLGLYQIYYGVKATFRRRLALDEMSQERATWVTRAGQVGYTARGVVLGVIGLFVMVAAATHDPDQARGLGGVLEALLQQPAGRWLLGAVALGLIAYGLYNGFEARYRRIEIASATR